MVTGTEPDTKHFLPSSALLGSHDIWPHLARWWASFVFVFLLQCRRKRTDFMAVVSSCRDASLHGSQVSGFESRCWTLSSGFAFQNRTSTSWINDAWLGKAAINTVGHRRTSKIIFSTWERRRMLRLNFLFCYSNGANHALRYMGDNRTWRPSYMVDVAATFFVNIWMAAYPVAPVEVTGLDFVLEISEMDRLHVLLVRLPVQSWLAAKIKLGKV